MSGYSVVMGWTTHWGVANANNAQRSSIMEQFEDSTGNLDYLGMLSKCITSLPLFVQLMLNSKEDKPMLDYMGENGTVRNNKEEDIKEDLSTLLKGVKHDTVTITKPVFVKGTQSSTEPDQLLDDLLDTPTQIPKPEENKINQDTPDDIANQSDEELEDWLDSVL